MKLIHHITHEHAELLPSIEHLKDAADIAGGDDAELIKSESYAAHDFLAHQLIPHAVSEDEVLYPLIARYAGNSDATNMMSYEHAEVARLTHRLEELLQEDPPERTELQHVLYSLHALVLLHFKKEEKFLLPILQDHLTEEDDAAAAQAMHESGRH